MNVQISSPNFTITESIRENLNRGVKKITMMNHQVQSVAISLKKEGSDFIVILRAKVKGKSTPAVIKKRSQNFYTALASVYSTVLATLKSKRDKKNTLKKQNLKLKNKRTELVDDLEGYVY